MERACHVNGNSKLQTIRKFNILNQTRILCQIVVELCIYLCWGLAGPD